MQAPLPTECICGENVNQDSGVIIKFAADNFGVRPYPPVPTGTALAVQPAVKCMFLQFACQIVYFSRFNVLYQFELS